MKKGQKMVFGNAYRAYLLVNYRIAGYNIASLATLFHCDKHTVERECGWIQPEEMEISFQKDLSRVSLPIIDVHLENGRQWLTTSDGDRINQGKSYKEYLKKSGYSPRIIEGLVYD